MVQLYLPQRLCCEVVVHELPGPWLVLVIHADPPAILARATVLQIVCLCLAADVLLVVDLRMVQLALPSKHRKALAPSALGPIWAHVVRANGSSGSLAHFHGPVHVRVRVEGCHG